MNARAGGAGATGAGAGGATAFAQFVPALMRIKGMKKAIREFGMMVRFLVLRDEFSKGAKTLLGFEKSDGTSDEGEASPAHPLI